MMLCSSPRCGVVVLVLVALGWVLGCAQPEAPRLNAPPQGAGNEKPDWATIYTYHNDQGLMADRSIADIHFIPGTADLSGVGVVRLERYAELMATRGGTLHYDAQIQDQELIDARLKTAQAFLAQVVPSSNPIHIVCGMPGGRGMSAVESKGGKDVAQTPEDRRNAYNLQVTGSK